MAWKTVKQIVAYARNKEKSIKTFRFTFTTNGMLLNDEITDFLNQEMHNVVLSLDGRKKFMIIYVKLSMGRELQSYCSKVSGIC